MMHGGEKGVHGAMLLLPCCETAHCHTAAWNDVSGLADTAWTVCAWLNDELRSEKRVLPCSCVPPQILCAHTCIVH
jgi:hypothetical protein